MSGHTVVWHTVGAPLPAAPLDHSHGGRAAGHRPAPFARWTCCRPRPGPFARWTRCRPHPGPFARWAHCRTSRNLDGFPGDPPGPFGTGVKRHLWAGFAAGGEKSNLGQARFPLHFSFENARSGALRTKIDKNAGNRDKNTSGHYFHGRCWLGRAWHGRRRLGQVWTGCPWWHGPATSYWDGWLEAKIRFGAGPLSLTLFL